MDFSKLQYGFVKIRKHFNRQPGHPNKLHGADRGQGPVQWASQKQQVPLVWIMMLMINTRCYLYHLQVPLVWTMMMMNIRYYLHHLQVPFWLIHLHLQSPIICTSGLTMGFAFQTKSTGYNFVLLELTPLSIYDLFCKVLE